MEIHDLLQKGRSSSKLNDCAGRQLRKATGPNDEWQRARSIKAKFGRSRRDKNNRDYVT